MAAGSTRLEINAVVSVDVPVPDPSTQVPKDDAELRQYVAQAVLFALGTNQAVNDLGASVIQNLHELRQEGRQFNEAQRTELVKVAAELGREAEKRALGFQQAKQQDDQRRKEIDALGEDIREVESKIGSIHDILRGLITRISKLEQQPIFDEQRVADIAWSKANDAIAAWWNTSVGVYDSATRSWSNVGNMRLHSLIYNKVMTTLERRGLASKDWKRAEPERYG